LNMSFFRQSSHVSDLYARRLISDGYLGNATVLLCLSQHHDIYPNVKNEIFLLILLTIIKILGIFATPIEQFDNEPAVLLV